MNDNPPMAKILFIDSTYPKPYDFNTLKQQAIGGTESSVLRTAEILQKNGHEVSVCQHTLEASHVQNSITFHSPLSCTNEPFDHVIVLRKLPQLINYQKLFPNAQFHLWLHTYKNREFSLKRLIRTPKHFIFIGNSLTHEKHLKSCLESGFLAKALSLFGCKKIPVTHAYNPISNFWCELQTEDINPNQLIFISAPNKGLSEVLSHFKTIKQQLPELTLLVANPGYRKESREVIDGVEYLGALPQKVLLKKVAESLCVFYPQTTFAETFGLIYAEANAVGTPVMAHDIGSAREVLHPDNDLVDGHDVNALIEQIIAWQKQNPMVGYRPEFDEAAVYKQWQNILNSDQSSASKSSDKEFTQ